MKNHTMQFFLTLAFLVFILIMQAQAAKASSVIYYLQNNATVQSVGAEGNTNYAASPTTIPYKNLLKNGTMGTQMSLTYDTPNANENTVLLFYLPTNYSVQLKFLQIAHLLLSGHLTKLLNT
jgi:hypothetical protein